MAELIEHDGHILEIMGTSVRVQIVQTSACQLCRAKTMCMSTESKEKTIVATLSGNGKIGDSVHIRIEEKMGWIAILLAYIVPFVLLVSGIALFGQWWSEVIAGAAAIGIVGIWYVILRLCRGKIEKVFQITAIVQE